MAVTPTSGTIGSNSAASHIQIKKSLSQEDFLNLLLTQMRYQDPLSPMDNYQMSAQLAQLGTIEGINKLTKSIETMSTYQASMAHLQVAGLVGKKVEAIGHYLVLKSGESAEGTYQLAQPGRVLIEIYDDRGKLVRTIDEGFKQSAKQVFKWDGRDQRGERLPDGTYVFSVKAFDAKGAPISATTSTIGVVDGISFENGVATVMIGSARIVLADIFAILS